MNSGSGHLTDPKLPEPVPLLGNRCLWRRLTHNLQRWAGAHSPFSWLSEDGPPPLVGSDSRETRGLCSNICSISYHNGWALSSLRLIILGNTHTLPRGAAEDCCILRHNDFYCCGEGSFYIYLNLWGASDESFSPAAASRRWPCWLLYLLLAPPPLEWRILLSDLMTYLCRGGCRSSEARS